MIVVLQDRTELVVAQKTADAIARSLSKSSEGYMTINGELIKKSFIVRIKQGGFSEADKVKAQEKNLLKSDNRTEAEQRKASLKKAAEIKEIIKKKGVKALANLKPVN